MRSSDRSPRRRSCRDIERLGDVPRLVTIQCSAYEYRLLAMGRADFCVLTGLKPWDHAAGRLIPSELGAAGRLGEF